MRSFPASSLTVQNDTKLAMDLVILPPAYELIAASQNRSH